ncbi:putative DNA binding domain-containing protein [Francisella tularensis subsp. novicida FSC159]|uniref:RNA-binding domain-containing protein n=1 Tax=Francisella tularensis TaxID=263 RepID=UPI001C0ED789|nr:RNA-binding domain-containing protein [Francisella tularensis]MBK2111674.1 putative DNA binding domain-containing protein [Francisella tularensis subsp. novicida FSC159]
MNILQRIQNGEDSYTQFKQHINNADSLAQELVAFSNANGGILIIGVADDGKIIGLSKDDIHRINQLISNVCSTNIKPPISILTKIENIDDKKILIIEINNGVNKPYSTNKGVYLTKVGSDKRKMSQEELGRLFRQAPKLYPDEEVLYKTSLENFDVSKFRKFLKTDNYNTFSKLENGSLDLPTILENKDLAKDGKLTLAGNLIFGEEPQRFCPSFYIDCCYFDGNDISVSKFISKKVIKGTFSELYEDTMRFLLSQLKSYQIDLDFNSNPQLEVSESALTEIVVNALVHRDYYINSSIKVFIFHNRVEIISPGKLPDTLTVDKIKNGIAIQRNPILASICKTLLPYTGYGSGIKRAIELIPNIEFINDIDSEQFRCIIKRDESSPKEQKSSPKEQESSPKEQESSPINISYGVESSPKTDKQILEMFRENPKITIKEIAERLSITDRAVKKHIEKLKYQGLIAREGSPRNGYWRVI